MAQDVGRCFVHRHHLRGVVDVNARGINRGEGFMTANSRFVTDYYHAHVVVALLDMGDGGQRDIQTDIAAHCVNGNDWRLARAHGAIRSYSSISICWATRGRTTARRPR